MEVRVEHPLKEKAISSEKCQRHWDQHCNQPAEAKSNIISNKGEGGEGSLKPGKMDSSAAEDKGRLHQKGKAEMPGSQHTLDSPNHSSVFILYPNKPSLKQRAWHMNSESKVKCNV